MKKLYRLSFLLTVLLLLANGTAFGQKKVEKKTRKSARKHLVSGEFEEAKADYLKLLKVNPDPSEYWFETGLAFYNSGFEREKSITYLEEAALFRQKNSAGETLENDSIGEVFYYLGRAYQYTGRWNEAIESYKTFKKWTENNPEGGELLYDVDNFIKQCNQGQTYTTDQTNEVLIENLGPAVNTKWPEYASVINSDETILIFTARRENNTGNDYYHDNLRYEDIYVTAKSDEEWINASKIDSTNKYISSRINSKYHDAAIGYSHDEKKLFIYREDDVWESTLEGGKWSEPIKFSGRINTAGHEPSVFITPDGNTLYVVSNREGGFGGRDLWKSERSSDGTWGEVTNLGPNINSAFDEDAPFLTQSAETLFYSSNGPGSIGGYDVFRSGKDLDGKWLKGKNIGTPINTAGDDIYYTQNEEGTIAYYSSDQPFGYGDMDIYRITLQCENIPNTEIRGLLVHEDDKKPIGGRILITDNETGEDVGTFDVGDDGKYLLILPPGRSYHFKVEAGDYLPHNADITIPRQCDFFQMYQEIHIRYTSEDGMLFLYPQKAVFQNAFYDIKSATETQFQLDDLNNITTQSVDNATDVVGFVKLANDSGAENVEVYLLNSSNEIVGITRTNDDGLVKFEDLDPAETYTLLIDQETLMASDLTGSTDLTANGDLFYGNIDGEPVRNMKVMVVDGDKKVLNARSTDDMGHWQFDNSIKEQDAIEAINGKQPFKYNVQVTDIDQIYSSFINTQDTIDNENDYTEVWDFIDIEEIEDYIRTNPQITQTTPTDSISFENILFDFDRFFLRDKSKEVLDNIVAYMKEHPEAELDIDGHTDWFGTDEYNMELSKKRSIAAINYLKRRGISGTRVKINYFGEGQPTAANANPDGSDNPDGRQLNRRCEFRVHPNGR